MKCLLGKVQLVSDIKRIILPVRFSLHQHLLVEYDGGGEKQGIFQFAGCQYSVSYDIVASVA